MSSGAGYPDWQEIQQWLGSPLDQAAGAAIGNGAINLGPYVLSSWASVIVAIKPTGGKVTVTVKQKIAGGPAALEVDEVFIVNAGSTLFEAVVLFGNTVSITLKGDTLGETVDYAIYPSNTTTNAQVITNATINVQHNDALVAAEQTLDFEDVDGFVWGIADDAANTRVKITPQLPAATLLGSVVAGVGGVGSISFSSIPQTYSQLLVVGELGSDGGADLDLYMRVNGIGTATYIWNGSKVIGGAQSYPSSPGGTQATVGFVQANAGQVMLAPVSILFPNYAAAGQKAQWLSQAGGNGFNQLLASYAGSQQNAGAIASLFFLPSGGVFRQGSRLDLYGLR